MTIASRVSIPELQTSTNSTERNPISGISRTTTDHDTIRRWTDARNGKPSRVPGTEEDLAGILRISFAAKHNDLESIPWDDFFEKFDSEGLAFVYQEVTTKGEVSRFCRLISR